MKVKFKFAWFAPSESFMRDKLRSFSGKFFRKGVHDVPEELRPFIPKSAKILDDDFVAPVVEPESHDLKDYDMVRHDSDELIAVANEAEINLKAKQDRMAKAREKIKRD